MRYGIRNGCLGGTWREVFAAAGQLGFDGVELDVGADYEQTPLWSSDGRRQLSEWARQSGAELSSVCIGALWKYSFG